MADITGTPRQIADFWQTTHHLRQRRQQLIERGRLIQADVDRALFHHWQFQRLHQDRRQITDVHEIPSLFAVAENRDGQAFFRALGEDADHPGIGRRRILAWTEDIEEAEQHRLQRMLATVEIQVVLARQFVRGIGGQRCLGCVFGDRLAFTVIAIHRSAGGKQHALDAGLTHGFADIQRADEITLMGAHRVIHRGLHRGHCRQVRDCVATQGCARHQRGVGDIALDQFQARVIHRQVAAFAGRQVIKDADGIALGEQGINQVRANESGAAGD